jgi:hypothetical protein
MEMLLGIFGLIIILLTLVILYMFWKIKNFLIYLKNLLNDIFKIIDF